MGKGNKGVVIRDWLANFFIDIFFMKIHTICCDHIQI